MGNSFIIYLLVKLLFCHLKVALQIEKKRFWLFALKKEYQYHCKKYFHYVSISNSRFIDFRYNSTCSDRGDRTATTVPMSQTPRYLQLIHSAGKLIKNTFKNRI